MLDETSLIPFCNDECTRLCHDATWGTWWVYAPTAGRRFPAARTPEGAWIAWYRVLANMTPNREISSVFLRAANDIERECESGEEAIDRAA